MRTIFSLLAIAAIGFAPLTFPAGLQRGMGQISPTVTIQQQGLLKQQKEQEDRARERRDFQAGRVVLERKGLPFDAEELLEDDWRVKLAPKLALVPEMQQKRRTARRINGAQLGDILYLPERVELTGDTFILANKVIFEGTDAVIKGNYNLYFYVSDVTGVLGTTLETAMQQQRHQGQMRFMNASLSNASPLRTFVPNLKPGGSITIDTSGQGWPEWLAKHKQATKSEFAGSTVFRHASLQDNDTHGQGGSHPSQANMGPPAVNASPNPAAGTSNGNCSGNPNGGVANGGASGGDGNEGDTGHPGGAGDGGGSQNNNLGSATVGTFNFDAHGGMGGQGGQGGDGSQGAPGGKGGPGGNGADCNCSQGGTGSGSNGGQGGIGGQGGQAGPGGPGGAGGPAGNISVRLMNDFHGTINHNVLRGAAGLPGEPGGRGLPGDFGQGGDPGHKPSGSVQCSSTNPPPTDGVTGPAGSSLGYGLPNSLGDPGTQPDHDGVYTELYQQTVNGPTCPTPPQDCASDDPPQIWKQSVCMCVTRPSPILIDVSGDGFYLTDYIGGVDFDLNGDGVKEHTAWTAAGSTNAFLVLDRNGNGVVDGGTELFGNYTLQPYSADPNGFIALAEFDKPQNGGNGDGKISNKDTVFSSLRLWQDANHNGVSEPGELHNMSEFGIVSLDLDYKESKRHDHNGNLFRFRAKVRDIHGAQVGRWAWDVFFASQP